MKKALDKIDAIVSNQRYFSNAMTIRKIRYTAMMGNKSEAIKMTQYLKNMPRGIIDKLKNEVEAI